MKTTIGQWGVGIRSLSDDGVFSGLKQRIPTAGGPSGDVAPISQRERLVLERLSIIESDEFIDGLIGKLR